LLTLKDTPAWVKINPGSRPSKAALTDAKKKRFEFASTIIKSESQVKNFTLEKDLLSAYANAEVKIVQDLEKAWYKDASSGDCYKVKIKAEIIPDVKAMETLSKMGKRFR